MAEDTDDMESGPSAERIAAAQDLSLSQVGDGAELQAIDATLRSAATDIIAIRTAWNRGEISGAQAAKRVQDRAVQLADQLRPIPGVSVAGARAAGFEAEDGHDEIASLAMSFASRVITATIAHEGHGDTDMAADDLEIATEDAAAMLMAAPEGAEEMVPTDA